MTTPVLLPEDEEGLDVVPEGPGSAIAVASALAVGAVLTGAAARPAPREPEVEHGAASEAPAEDPAVSVTTESAALLPVLEGLRSDDPAVRRETAGVVERLARDPDPRCRLALAAALRRLGGREAVLPLCLLVGDEDPDVRIVARRAMLAEAKR
jgi:hypothetical protein